jgi:hypothetical protein
MYSSMDPDRLTMYVIMQSTNDSMHQARTSTSLQFASSLYWEGVLVLCNVLYEGALSACAVSSCRMAGVGVGCGM